MAALLLNRPRGARALADRVPPPTLRVLADTPSSGNCLMKSMSYTRSPACLSVWREPTEERENEAQPGDNPQCQINNCRGASGCGRGALPGAASRGAASGGGCLLASPPRGQHPRPEAGADR